MFDPAALGTLMIGLEANRREDDYAAARARAVRARPRRASTRQRLAATLRWTAARIEPAGSPAR